MACAFLSKQSTDQAVWYRSPDTDHSDMFWRYPEAGHVTRPAWLRSDHVDDPCGQTGRDGWYSRAPISQRLSRETRERPACSPFAAGYLTSAAVTRNGSAPRSRRPWRGRIQAGSAGPWEIPCVRDASTLSGISSRVRLSFSLEPSGRYLRNQAVRLLG